MSLTFKQLPNIGDTVIVNGVTYIWNSNNSWDSNFPSVAVEAGNAYQINGVWYISSSDISKQGDVVQGDIIMSNTNIYFNNANSGIYWNNGFSYITTDAGGNLILITNNSALQLGNSNVSIGPAFDQANLALTVANLAFNQSNTDLIIANLAFDKANAANLLAFNSGTTANFALTVANAAFAAANGAVSNGGNSILTFTVANNAYNQSNTDLLIANLAFDHANIAYNVAMLVFDKANLIQLTTNDHSNVITTLNVINLSTSSNISNLTNVIVVVSNNQNNMSNTINVSFGVANSASINAALAYNAQNNTFLVANNGSNFANSSFLVANNASGNAALAFGQGNNAMTNALSASVNAALGFGVANSASTNAALAYGAQNNTFLVANNASNFANASFGVANSASINAALGFGVANSASANAALAFGQGNNAFTLGTKASINAALAFGQANSATTIGSVSFDTANAAFGAQNNTFLVANNAYNLSNTANQVAFLASSNAALAFGQGNTALTVGSAAFDNQNNTLLIANNGSNFANAAFGQGNSAFTLGTKASINAAAAYGQANTATTIGQSAYGAQNNTFLVANNAYNLSNTANQVAFLASSNASGAYGKANGSVQIGWTKIITKKDGGTITPSSNADTLYFGNTSNLLVTSSTSNLFFDLTLTNVTPSVYGRGNTIPVFTVDSSGRLQAASNTQLNVATGDIQSSAITASKIYNQDPSNMLLDVDFTDLIYWNLDNGLTVNTTSQFLGNNWLSITKALQSDIGNGSNSQSSNIAKTNLSIPIESSKYYRSALTTFVSNGYTGRVTTQITWITGDSTFNSITTSNNIIDFRTVASNSNTIIIQDSQLQAPANAAFAVYRIRYDWSTTQNNAGYALSAFPRFNRVIGVKILEPTGVTVGSYGDGNNTPTFTVDSAGRVILVSNTPIAMNSTLTLLVNNAYNLSNTANQVAFLASSNAALAFGQGNTALTVGQSAYGAQNNTFLVANNGSNFANSSFLVANNASGNASLAFGTANNALVNALSASVNAALGFGVANSASANAALAYGHSNNTFIVANNAYNSVNTKLDVSGGGLTGTLTFPVYPYSDLNHATPPPVAQSMVFMIGSGLGGGNGITPVYYDNTSWRRFSTGQVIDAIDIDPATLLNKLTNNVDDHDRALISETYYKLYNAGLFIKLKALWVHAMYNSTDAKLNWIDPGNNSLSIAGTSLTFLPYIGFRGRVGSYLDSGPVSNYTETPLLSNTNISIGTYVLYNGDTANCTFIGTSSSSSRTILMRKATSGNVARLVDLTDDNIPYQRSNGMVTLVRNNTSNYNVYLDNQLVTTVVTANAGSYTSANITFLGTNDGVGTEYSNGTICFSFIAQSLTKTDIEELRSIMVDFFLASLGSGFTVPPSYGAVPQTIYNMPNAYYFTGSTQYFPDLGNGTPLYANSTNWNRFGITKFLANGNATILDLTSNTQDTLIFANTSNIIINGSGTTLSVDLVTTGVTPGIYGGQSNNPSGQPIYKIPIITVDSSGRITAISNVAEQANSFIYTIANAAYDMANSANVLAFNGGANAALAFAQGNTAYSVSNAAFGVANSASSNATLAFGKANLQANIAFSKISANSGAVTNTALTNASTINFVGTANVSVNLISATSNVVFDLAPTAVTPGLYGGQANNITGQPVYNLPSLTIDSSGRITAVSNVAVLANSVLYTIANTAFAQGNTAQQTAVAAFTQANLNSSGSASVIWNKANVQTNVAFSIITANSGAATNTALSNASTLNFVGTANVRANIVPSTSNVVFDLAPTAVTPGIYGSSNTIPSFTVDSSGRITSIANNTNIVLVNDYTITANGKLGNSTFYFTGYAPSTMNITGSRAFLTGATDVNSNTANVSILINSVGVTGLQNFLANTLTTGGLVLATGGNRVNVGDIITASLSNNRISGVNAAIVTIVVGA